jgi:hypothetical protein
MTDQQKRPHLLVSYTQKLAEDFVLEVSVWPPMVRPSIMQKTMILIPRLRSTDVVSRFPLVSDIDLHPNGMDSCFGLHLH